MPSGDMIQGLRTRNAPIEKTQKNGMPIGVPFAFLRWKTRRNG